MGTKSGDLIYQNGITKVCRLLVNGNRETDRKRLGL